MSDIPHCIECVNRNTTGCDCKCHYNYKQIDIFGED